jgi:predicted nucleic acid-binding Zn ribbon protein
MTLAEFFMSGEKQACEACGLPGARLKVPGLPGRYCNIACIETQICGGDHCRWCGGPIEETYTGINSRLCSDDCGANYRAQVGTTAALGMGVRFLVWLQKNRMATYLELYREAKIVV